MQHALSLQYTFIAVAKDDMKIEFSSFDVQNDVFMQRHAVDMYYFLKHNIVNLQ